MREPFGVQVRPYRGANRTEPNEPNRTRTEPNAERVLLRNTGGTDDPVTAGAGYAYMVHLTRTTRDVLPSNSGIASDGHNEELVCPQIESESNGAAAAPVIARTPSCALPATFAPCRSGTPCARNVSPLTRHGSATTASTDREYVTMPIKMIVKTSSPLRDVLPLRRGLAAALPGIARDLAAGVRRRTESGRDVNGRAFRRKRRDGSPSTLTDSGRMVESFRPQTVSETGFTLAPTGRRNVIVGAAHQSRGRRWVGADERQIEAAREQIADAAIPRDR